MFYSQPGCLQVFDQVAAQGFSMTLLDLGGGCPGGQWDSQGQHTQVSSLSLPQADADSNMSAGV